MAIERKDLLIEGMTCINCQNRIEQALRNIAGIEYSCAVTPQVRQMGNRLSGLAGTAYASLLA